VYSNISTERFSGPNEECLTSGHLQNRMSSFNLQIVAVLRLAERPHPSGESLTSADNRSMISLAFLQASVRSQETQLS